MISNDTVATLLEERAQADQPIFYGNLAGILGVAEPLYPFPQNPLSRVFDDLDEEDSRRNRPFRTAMVISQEANMPGPGFFKMYDRLRGTETRKSEQQELWLKEYRRVTAYNYAADRQNSR